MKKICIGLFLSFAIFALILFQSCNHDVSQTKKMDIDPQNYPRIDGSTSSLPIVQGAYKAFHEPEIINGEEIWNDLPQSASKTIESYKMLIDGELDLIIVPDPSEEVWELAKEKCVELEYIPICVEGLVFITHKSMPIDNITTEQLKSIYIDMQINNWSQLGSDKDLIIDALIRNEDSGSHALMEKFILEGEKINETIDENNKMLTMVAMIEEVETYLNGHIDADRVNKTGNRFPRFPLGYTLYYFLQNNEEIQKWENIKTLSIDGIEPNNQTITTKEYPYSTYYYVVIRSTAPANSTERTLLQWLLSDEGKKMIDEAGFGSIN